MLEPASTGFLPFEGEVMPKLSLGPFSGLVGSVGGVEMEKMTLRLDLKLNRASERLWPNLRRQWGLR